MPFHDAYSRPTAEQFALIGEIVTDAAIIDYLLCQAISRLAGTPDFLGLAIMEKMNLFGRTEAMNRLLDLHVQRYRGTKVPLEVVGAGGDIVKKLERLRNTRNDAAHAILFRMSDEGVFALKPLGRPGDVQGRQRQGKDGDARIIGPLNNTDLRRLATELAQLAGDLEAFLARLPEVPEAPAG